jgi:RNase P/RNase MRP subunit p29
MSEILRDLIGLRIEILKSTDLSHIGQNGLVQMETKNMIVIRLDQKTTRKFEKKILLLGVFGLKYQVLDGARIKNIYSRSTITGYEHKN